MIELASAQREELEQVANSHTAASGRVQRAQAVLEAANGDTWADMWTQCAAGVNGSPPRAWRR